MKKEKHIKKSIIALLLAMLVLFPVVIKSTHHHSNEINHVECNNEASHIHESLVDFCDICLFSVSSFNHLFPSTENLTPFIINIETPKKDYYFKVSTSTYTTKQLRAPPFLL